MTSTALNLLVLPTLALRWAHWSIDTNIPPKKDVAR
jgi:hypothetical protein